MSYEPKEGVDYLIDLYAVAGVPSDSQADELKHALNERAKEYHPDRLLGVAPEFRQKGERMAILLNRARHILLNSDSRGEYDLILAEWDGPLSNDGTPVITMDRHLQMQMHDMSPNEVEAVFEQQAEQITNMTGYNPSRLSFLESLLASDSPVSNELRAEYEDALLQQDRTLAIQEAERSRLLGLPDPEKSRYVAALGYADEVGDKIEIAREERKEQLQIQSLGGVGARLALLAGEQSSEEPDGELAVLQQFEMPAYFEEQAARVKAIAVVREAITEKRLANFMPVFPEAELQTGFREDVAIGIAGKVWLGGKVVLGEQNIDVVSLPDDISELLEQGDITAVIKHGYNVLTFEPLDQLDIQDLIATALEKYIEKYQSISEEK